MKHLILTLLLLSGCSMHHIQSNDKDALEISLNHKSIVKGKGKIIYKNNVRISHINVYQKIFKMNNNTVLTYEDAIVDTEYKFNHGMKRILSIIFSSNQYQIIDYKANLYFAKIYTQNRQLYVIIENLNKKRLKFIYGFSEQVFNGIQSRIIDNNPILETDPILSEKKTISITSPQKYISSTWSEKNIILDTLVAKVSSGRIKHK